jgi:hypothetical protein
MRGVVALALATSLAVAGACGASTTAEKASAAKGTNQKVGVEVTDKTKMIANGIETRVVRDTVTENGAPVEITDDWYAQDKAGNVWYLDEWRSRSGRGALAALKRLFSESAPFLRG